MTIIRGVSGAKLQGGTNYFTKTGASLFVYTEIARSITKIYEL